MRDDMPRPTPNTDYYGNRYDRRPVYPDNRDTVRVFVSLVVSSTLGTCVGVMIVHFIGLI